MERQPVEIPAIRKRTDAAELTALELRPVLGAGKVLLGRWEDLEHDRPSTLDLVVGQEPFDDDKTSMLEFVKVRLLQSHDTR